MTKKTAIILSTLMVLMLFSYVYFNFQDITGLSSVTGFQLLDTRLVIISENETVCNTTFEQGWNLVSFPCISSDIDASLFLTGLNSSYQSIRTYVPGSPDPWKSYNPNVPSWVLHDLEDVSRKEGYWIFTESQSQFYLNSTLATPSLIDLTPGWNLIGYPSETIRKVNDTFDEIIPNFDYVYSYNASHPTDKWKQWTWNSSLASNQDLNYTVPYRGYWVYVINSDTLVIT